MCVSLWVMDNLGAEKGIAISPKSARNLSSYSQVDFWKISGPNLVLVEADIDSVLTKLVPV